MRSLSRVTLTYPLAFEFEETPTNPWWVDGIRSGVVHQTASPRGNDLLYTAMQLGWARSEFGLRQEQWPELPNSNNADRHSLMEYRVNPSAVIASAVVSPGDEGTTSMLGWAARNLLCTTNLRDWFNPIWLPSYNSGVSLHRSVTPLRGATIRFHGWDFERAPYWFACILLYRLLLRRLSASQRLAVMRSVTAEVVRASDRIDGEYLPTGNGPVIFSREPDNTLVMCVNSVWSESFPLSNRGLPTLLIGFIDTITDPSWVLFNVGDLDNLRELAIGVLYPALEESVLPLTVRYERALQEYVNL